jgi:hypothetical protein
MRSLRKAELAERRQAIHRGVKFVYRIACDPEHFEAYGFDHLFAFYSLYSTSRDKYLRDMAREMGCERARFWRHQYPILPRTLDADTVTHFVFACTAAEGFGFADEPLKAQLRQAAGRFSARDYFWFDPNIEPPPRNVPQCCECGLDNRRGRQRCRGCRKVLEMMSRYEVWLVALIRSYLGQRYGVKLGSLYRDVLKWLPLMRPYCEPTDEYSLDFIWSIYAITHVVYTLNGYGVHKLKREWLPNEFVFLKKHLIDAIHMDDPETMGELLDALKAFGLTSEASLIRRGEEFILSRQNSDGSWGEMTADDIYERYHPTLTAIDGLRRHAWRGPGLRFRDVRSLLKQSGAVAPREKGCGNRSET